MVEAVRGSWNMAFCIGPVVSGRKGCRVVERYSGRTRARVSLINWPKVLNDTGGRPAEKGDDGEKAGALQGRIKELLVEHLDPEGGRVDYAAFRKSPDLKVYEKDAAQLNFVDPTSLGREERIAFFMNLYNSLLIHSFVKMGYPKSLPERLVLYSKAAYSIGGQVYTLNDMEHNVLRGNAQQPLDPLGLQKWKPSDPRYKTIVNPIDPRIHFALNCGAMSCPPIRFYTADNLDYGLSSSTGNFIDNPSNVRVLKSSRVVYLSQIFSWYKTDFAPSGSDRQLIKWVADNAYEGTDTEKDLHAMCSEKDDIKVEFIPYDWSVNDAGP